MEFLEFENLSKTSFEGTFVLKIGNTHCGEGKFLATKETISQVEPYEGVASVEPFFSGRSFRVLFLADREFVLHYTNENSWIKNSAGADVTGWPVENHHFSTNMRMVQHARAVKDHFGLEVCGIDYILDDDNVPHFLEYNCFPGVGATDEISAAAASLFSEKMKYVEELAKSIR